MGTGPGDRDTGSTDAHRRAGFPTHRSHPMYTIRHALKALLLSLVLIGSAHATDKVNINTADAATLDRVLVGVGPSKADAIVAYRKQNGAFRSVEQLAAVKGIGLATVERNRDRILVG